MIKKLNTYTRRKYVFVFLLLIGCVFTLLFSTLLKHNLYQFGPDTLAFFFPPFLTTLYFTVFGYQSGFTKRLLAESFLLFLIILIPLWQYLFKIVLPNPGVDFVRYMIYAKNMVQQKTLWGGDQLVFKNQSMALITQPGIRYFIALELLVFKELYRFISILNLLIFCCSVFLLQKIIAQTIIDKKLKVLMGALVLLSVPYAAKNVLMGLSEWLTVSLLIGAIYVRFFRNTPMLSFVLLALIPFFRQNALPTTLLLFVLFLYNQKIRVVDLLVFAVVLLLPLYHNLYYAGEWRFFTSIFKWPFLNYNSDSEISDPNGFSFFHILNNSLHYLGIHFKRDHEIDFMEEAFLFLWLFLFLFVYMGRHLVSKQLKLFYYISNTFLVLLPGILLSTDFYPRFEFVNIYLIISVFLIIYQFDKKHSALSAIKQ